MANSLPARISMTEVSVIIAAARKLSLGVSADAYCTEVAHGSHFTSVKQHICIGITGKLQARFLGLSNCERLTAAVHSCC
eukprot:1136838-Pelagomonas_calceolata.AAC.5